MVRVGMILAVLTCVAAPLALAGSVLEVNAADCDGPADGRVLYARWDEAGQRYTHLHSRPLSKGSDRVALTPGRYRVTVVYTETVTPQEQTVEAIEVLDGAEVTQHFCFGKATAEIKARDNDWHWRANARLHLYQWDEKVANWMLVKSRSLPDRKTRQCMYLAPGEYKVRVTYLETRPQTEAAETTFTAKDGEVVSVLALFRHGEMPTRRKHAPLERRDSGLALTPNEALTERTDNTE